MSRTLIIGFLALLLVGSVVAEVERSVPSFRVEESGAVAQPANTELLGFIKGTSGTAVRHTKVFDAYENYFAIRSDSVDLKLGTACETGEYIVALRCRYQWGNCERYFDDDWFKSDPDDLLPIYQYTDSSWYQQGEDYRPWNVYQCRESLPSIEPEPEHADGYFSRAISYSSDPKTNDYITIQGSYYATKSGPFVLEAMVDPTDRRSLAIIDVAAGRSSCDGSNFWAGKKIQGVAGNRYDFKFTVKTPAEPGNYRIQAHAWTDCERDGGEQIAATDTRVDIEDELFCQAKSFVDSWASYLAGRDRSWTLSSSSALSNELEKYGCTLSDAQDYCGTRDSDGDGIPDGCDYCPQDQGPPGDRNGCHPCFGMDIYSSAGKQCYLDNEGDWGIPDRYLDVVNPIVREETSCRDSTTVLIEKIRENGDVASSNTNDCASGQECTVDSGEAICADVRVEVDRTERVCSNGDVAVRTYYSDGSNEITGIREECSFGCDQAQCLDDPNVETCEGGVICDGQDPGVVVEDPECSTDQECGLGEYCLDQVCQSDPSYCSSDSDCASDEYCGDSFRCYVLDQPECQLDSECQSGYECESQVCVVADQPAEDDLSGPGDSQNDTQNDTVAGCLFDSDCGENEVCLGSNPQGFEPGSCEVTSPWEENETVGSCIDDVSVTCETGGSVITAMCVQGELVPTDVTCESEYDGSSGGISDGPKSSIDRTGGSGGRVSWNLIERVELPSLGGGGSDGGSGSIAAQAASFFQDLWNRIMEVFSGFGASSD